MDSLTVTNARKNLYKLIEETAASHQPVKIMGKSVNAVLISEADWEGINDDNHYANYAHETLIVVSCGDSVKSKAEGHHEATRQPPRMGA